jgi:hemerythrin-like domain-containing protein
MNAVDAIVAEHQAILEAFDAFQIYVAEVERGSATRADLVRFVELLEGFVESHHRCREEELLLTTMTSAGVEVGAEALSMSRERHARARELLDRLRSAAARETSWTARDRRTVIEVASSYTRLMREHLHWELRVLVPILQTQLSGIVLDALGDAQSEAPGDEGGELDELRVELLRAYPQRGSVRASSV